MLFTRFSKILFDKRLGRVFTLKQVAKFFKHVSAELLKPYEKTKSREFKKFRKVFKKLGQPTCLRYNRVHGVPISHGREN